jgi:hypothetical protein
MFLLSFNAYVVFAQKLILIVQLDITEIYVAKFSHGTYFEICSLWYLKENMLLMFVKQSSNFLLMNKK